MRAFVLVLAVAAKANEQETITNEHCSAVVQGAVAREGSWWSDLMGVEMSHCKCPGNTVISGSGICASKNAKFEQYFDLNDAVKDQNCKCEFKSGCGIVEISDMNDLIPANAAKKGMPAPIIVGNKDNINTGVPELDKEFFGLWWMKDNPVDEELASMAGAFSRLTGQSKSPEQVTWPLVVGVPNSKHSHWAWPNNWMGRKIIMSQYTSATDKANDFIMRSTTEGSIHTTLNETFGVWVEEWGLYKIDEDTWNRPTTFQDGSPWPDTNYTLTRILKEDGTATKYFAEFKRYMEVNKSNESLLIWDTDDLCKRKCMLAGESCAACYDCCEGGTNVFGEAGHPKNDCPYKNKEPPKGGSGSCASTVTGAVDRPDGWLFSAQTECMCPEGTVITGEAANCQAHASVFDMFFDVKDLEGDGCSCAYQAGCGIRKITDIDEVIPGNSRAKGKPPPVILGTSQNIRTGVPALDKEFFGIWWMKDNPVPEELASMAGAFSKYTGQESPRIEWPVTVGVPNSVSNKWAWPETWIAKKVIMPGYTSAIDKANNFTMRSPTAGSIDTTLTTQWGVWVEEWGLYKIDKDTWNRPTTFQDGSPWPDTNYTLTRIVNEDGSPTEHWETYKTYMKEEMDGAPLLVWDDDDACKRKCMLAGESCQYCHWCCKGGCDGKARPACSYKVDDVPDLSTCTNEAGGEDGFGNWTIAGASTIEVGWQSIALVLMSTLTCLTIA